MEKNRPEIREDLIIGRNCVSEAINSGREIDSIYVTRGNKSGNISVILAKAKDRGIPIKEADIKKLDYLCAHGNHQGIVAISAAKEYSSIDDVFALAKERGEDPFIILLDEIEDPHNLGAIIRTAECAGAHGVVIPKRRAVGLTHIVNKASAGALEYVPVVRVTNMASFIDTLKDNGVWVYAADMNGELIYNANLKGSIALVVGSEGKGIGRLVREKCDGVISLPMQGKINSLNASVAAGISIYEIAKQRKGL